VAVPLSKQNAALPASQQDLVQSSDLDEAHLRVRLSARADLSESQRRWVDSTLSSLTLRERAYVEAARLCVERGEPRRAIPIGSRSTSVTTSPTTTIRRTRG